MHHFSLLTISISILSLATSLIADQLEVGRQFPAMRFDSQEAETPFLSGKKTVVFVYASW